MLGLGGIFYASEWLIRIIMIPVVAHQRRRPLEAIAWLAVIFFVPWIGAALYLWLAEYSLQQGRKRHADARRQVERLHPLSLEKPHIVHPALDSAQALLVRTSERLMEDRLGGLPVLGGNAVELLKEEEAVDRIVEDIDAAQYHVHLLFFIFNDDDTGWRVAHALERARQRGVRCRVLADSWASRSMFKNLAPWMEERGIEVYGLLKLNPLRRPLVRFDVRNHRKIAVMDGRVAITGSTNLHDSDWNLDDGLWYQITARVEGPAALQLQLVFLEDWYMSTEQVIREDHLLPHPVPAGDIAVQTLPTGPAYETHALQHLVVEMLHEAEERITITSPYFVPDQPSLIALRLAALRGAEVDIIIPEESDRSVADAAARGFFEELIEVGVRIYRHPRGVVHAKTISIDDDVAFIGTANFDRRSMFLNYEVSLMIYDPRVTHELRRRQIHYLSQSRIVDLSQWRKRSTWDQVRDDTAKLLSPLL